MQLTTGSLCLLGGEWRKLLALMQGAFRMVQQKRPSNVEGLQSNATAAAAKPLDPTIFAEWDRMVAEVARLQQQMDRPQNDGLAFTFVEGSLVRALREGHWLLLDEARLL